MKTLLEQSQTGLKVREGKSETFDVTISDIRGTKTADKVAVVTDKGTFFPFINKFHNGKLPMIGKAGLKATITLRELTNEKGTIAIVDNIKLDVDSMSGKQIAASYGMVLGEA